MLSDRAITIKFVTFCGTFVYDCTALVPADRHVEIFPIAVRTGYCERTIGEVTA